MPEELQASAHRTVQAALAAARVRVRELHAVQGDAVETLARALVGDGNRLKNPFTAFGAPAPSTIARLAVTDGATAIARLVAAVMRRKDTSSRSVHAARAARAKRHALSSRRPNRWLGSRTVPALPG